MAAEAHNPSRGTDRVAKLRVEYAMARSSHLVIPAEAGIQGWRGDATAGVPLHPAWIPASAGMTFAWMMER